jgi:hypothetical protein
MVLSSSCRALAIVLVFCGITGCSQVTGSATPGVNLSQYRTYHVVRDQQSDASDAVQKALAARGYVVTTGPETALASGTECKVLVRDHWTWDMTMYLLELQVDIINPRTGAMLAQGRSYHPSLERKSAEFMANEVVEKMYGPAAKP